MPNLHTSLFSDLMDMRTENSFQVLTNLTDDDTIDSLAGSEVRVPLGESIWILANDFGENPQNPFMDSVKINCENPF